MKKSRVDMRFDEPAVDGIRGAANQKERVAVIAESAAWSECVKNDCTRKRGDDEFPQGKVDHKLRGFYFDDVLRSPAFLEDVFLLVNLHPRRKDGRPAQITDDFGLSFRVPPPATGRRLRFSIFVSAACNGSSGNATVRSVLPASATVMFSRLAFSAKRGQCRRA